MKAKPDTSSNFLAACRRIPGNTTPVWFMRQAGRYLPDYRKIREKYDLLTMCKTPELAAEVTLQPVRILEVDAAIIFADLLLPFEPMGISIHFAKGEGPVIENPVSRKEDVDSLREFDPKEGLAYVLASIAQVKSELKDIPVIGFAGAPFTLASYLLEGGHSQSFLKTKRFMYDEPESWKNLMEKIAKVISGYLTAQIEAGASAVQLFDSWAGILSPPDYLHFVLPHSASIIREVSKTKAPVIHFATGQSGMLKIFTEAGGDVVGIDWRVSLDEAWEATGYGKGIQGNLDPAALFAPANYLEKEVKSILQKAGGRPGHIFNLGHGILPGTPVDSVKRVVEWVKTYSGG